MRLGVVAGFASVFRGAAFVARHRLWAHLLLPLLASVLAAVGAAYLALRLVARWTGEVWIAVGWLDAAAHVVAGLALGALAFVALAPVLSAPFIDYLCEKVEAIQLGREPPQAGIIAGLGQALAHGALKTALYLIALVVTLVLGALTGLGGVLGVILYGVFVAYDGFDYPLGRRGAGFAQKWRYLLARPGLCGGYAAGVALLYFVPLAGLVAPAFAAVGATLAFLDEEATRGTPGVSPSARTVK